MERSLVIGNAVGHMKPHLDEETGLEEEKWNGGTSAEGGCNEPESSPNHR